MADHEDIDHDFFDVSPRDNDTPKSVQIPVKAEVHASPVDKPVPSAERKPPVPASRKKLEARIPSASTDKSDRKSNRDYSDSDTSSFTDSYSDEEKSSPDAEKSSLKSKQSESDSRQTDSKRQHQNKDDRRYTESESESDEEHSYIHRKTQSRPKSAKARSQGSSSKGNAKYRDDLSDSYSSSSYTSSSETDSDVTDVSPLATPEGSPREKEEKDEGRWATRVSIPEDKPSLHLELREQLLRGNHDSTDLHLLMQAVLDLERQQNEQKSKSNKTLFLVPPPHSSSKAAGRNMSFNDYETRKIERENERLMHEILKQAREAKLAKEKRKPQVRQSSAMSRMTHSAVNRQRDLRRIETENKALLKRLEKTKATKTLRRDSLLNDYNKQVLFGVPVASVHPVPKRKRPTSASPYHDSLGSRTRSLTSLRSDASSMTSQRTCDSSKSTSRRGRPQSAHFSSVRKPRFVTTRPSWEPGW